MGDFVDWSVQPFQHIQVQDMRAVLEMAQKAMSGALIDSCLYGTFLQLKARRSMVGQSLVCRSSSNGSPLQCTC
jgi:hypothetical protein